MIISRTPFRISFFGGGTDYPAWYRNHGGAVLATAIDKYCYITCRYLPPFFEHKLRVVYSQIENVQCVDQIKHPAAREVLRFMNIDRGIEIHHDGDLPARSGMGSSSAFTVGLLNAIYALSGHIVSKERLSKESIHIEQEMIRETVGSQDQVSVAYGGLNHIIFQTNDEIAVRPITLLPCRKKELNDHLMLFYTGIKRTASNIADSFVNKMEDQRRQLRVTKDLVDEGISVLGNNGDIRAFGELLDEAWKVKRSLSSLVTNRAVDDLYDAAISAGAIGGKLTGAGGGGFLLLFVPPEKQACVREKLDKLIYVPFHLESNGSQIIYYDPEQDFSEVEKDRANHKVLSFRELAPDMAVGE